jgi:hypothetical protein
MTDPTVFGMQMFALGYGPQDNPSIVDRMFIHTPWFRETKSSLDRALGLARGARKEAGVRGEGPSRGGKTCVTRALIRGRMPWRDDKGLHIPLGYLRVPSIPSVAVVGQDLLRALGDPTWRQHRSPSERLSRIGEVVAMVGLEALLVDDLHHLVDSRGTRVQHVVADMFIDIGSETGVPLVFLGLKRMAAVFDVNEQLRGRTGAPIEYLRLDWRKTAHRDLFREALKSILDQFRLTLPVDKSIDDVTIPFRMYCSSGGLLGYLVLIFRVAECECRRRRVPLSSEVLKKAVGVVVAKSKYWPGGRDPFHRDFVADATAENLRIAQGVGIESGPTPKKKSKATA